MLPLYLHLKKLRSTPSQNSLTVPGQWGTTRLTPPSTVRETDDLTGLVPTLTGICTYQH